MKRLLAFLFLVTYLLNQAAYALPAFNNTGMAYEFKKKCRYGKKDRLFKKSSSRKTISWDEQKKSEKKVVSFCSADVHTILHNDFKFTLPVAISHQQVYKTAAYSCSTSIHSPPPLF